MLKNLAFTMLTAVYYSVIPVYCFMQLFYSVGASIYQVV